MLYKQILGCNPQQVDQFLAEMEKKQAEELNKILADIHTTQLKNQQQIIELSILLKQFDQYREQEQAMIAQYLEQVKELEQIHIKAMEVKNAAHLEFSAKLDELSNAYHAIDTIKNILSASYKELAHLQQL